MRCKPSSKSILASKPNSAFALVISKHLLGCPSGFEAFQTTSPLNPVLDEFYKPMVSKENLLQKLRELQTL